MSEERPSTRGAADAKRGNIAQARRDADDKRTADIAHDRQKRLAADAVKTDRLRGQRLAKEAADKIAADGAIPPEPSTGQVKKSK